MLISIGCRNTTGPTSSANLTTRLVKNTVTARGGGLRRIARGKTGASDWPALDGCRIGFDLGGGDRKAAAVIDGEEVQ